MKSWENLAPELIRQRVIIEAITDQIVKPDEMKKYLLALAEEVDMEVLSGPFAYTAHEMGFGGWIHWKSSGAHIYSYPTKKPLVTVDIYTCKPFCIKRATEFTEKHFSTIKLVAKEFEV